MARKRMLSPDIWESESFSSLSDFQKIMFIGLISLADDEGRGKANPSYIKSTLFPYDENRRVAEVKSALSQIARCTSTQFYNVNGSEYYFLSSWTKWQKIDKPSKSKLPPPPKSDADSGVGALLPESEKNEKFDEYSTNTPRTFDEGSSIKKNKNKNKNKNINTTTNVVVAIPGLTTEQYSSLCADIGKADCDYYISRVKAFLKKHPKANLDVYSTILKWRREDVKSEPTTKVEKTYTSEQLNAMFENYGYDDM